MVVDSNYAVRFHTNAIYLLYKQNNNDMVDWLA